MFSKLSDVKTMDFISEDLKTNKVIIASHITMNSLFLESIIKDCSICLIKCQKAYGLRAILWSP